MKVLLLINSFGAGGAERSTLELARYLVSREVSVVAAALTKKDVGIERQFRALDAEVVIGEGNSRRERLSFVIETIKSTRPDIAHSVVFESNLLLRLAKPFIGDVKIVQSIVNTPYVSERVIPGKKAKFKFWLAKMADIASARATSIHYHSITRAVLDHYRPLFNIGEEDYTMIHRGRRANPYLDSREFPTAGLKLINVGRQDFQKGQNIILEALHLLEREAGITDIRLTILGRQGTETPLIENTIEKYALTDRVELKGFTDSVESELVQADVFVFPSYFEGLGGALIEAMAAGLPCICTDIPVLREVIGEPEGALFFETGNSRQLADRVREIYQDAALYRRLHESSLRRFAAAFEIDSISRQMLNMYRKLLDK